MNVDTGIYKITSPSGRCYVGSSMSFKRRWNLHRSRLRNGTHHNNALQRAYEKYGEDGLNFEKIALCAIPELIVLEQRYIDKLKPEYNHAPIAGSTLGITLGPHSEDHKRKISEAHTGLQPSDETRKKLSEGQRRRKGTATAEQRRARSAAMVGDGNPFFGKSHTPETIEKVSGANHHSSVSVMCVETGIVFHSVAQARNWLRENGRPSAQSGPIIECCKSSTRYKKPYGYTWKYQ